MKMAIPTGAALAANPRPLRTDLSCPACIASGNFILEFLSINSPILTLTHAWGAELVCGADDKFSGVHMHQRENRRVYARKFQNEITRAMHAGQERLV